LCSGPCVSSSSRISHSDSLSEMLAIVTLRLVEVMATWLVRIDVEVD